MNAVAKAILKINDIATAAILKIRPKLIIGPPGTETANNSINAFIQLIISDIAS